MMRWLERGVGGRGGGKGVGGRGGGEGIIICLNDRIHFEM